jgi:hypothetical protein
MAEVIQKQLARPGFAGTIEDAEKGIYAGCAENIYTLTDKNKLSDVYLTNMATDDWYKGRYSYDFDAGAPKAGAAAAKVRDSNEFVRMVW